MEENKHKTRGITIFIVMVFGLLILVVATPLIRGFPTSYSYLDVNGKEVEIYVDSRNPSNTLHIIELSYKDGNVIRKADVPFKYSPNELENYKVPEGLSEKISNSKGIFIVSDPYLTEKIDYQDIVAQVTISRITGSERINLKPHVLGIDTFRAISREIEGDDSPVLNCINATETGRIIYLKQGIKNEIYYDNDNPECVVIEFVKEKDVVRGATRLVYSLIGLMP